ncbi:aminotransferase class I/II-fold pyridoxal phosphate-dependent enzyme [Flavobacterium sp. PL12]|uniref:aminotransferase class I/II-fold pyridoxal phosphate-dependent enzyme n=1 Tax=Flavobacterium sp. PL12 TaxID=3071718 RepID=UPI00319D9D0E
MKVDQFPDRTIEINGEEYLYFGGTAYLGLPTNHEFQQLLIKNILKWGTAYGSSRNANIKLSAYDNAEKFLANFIHSESAVTVSSGMLAGKLVVEALEEQTDCFFHFPNTHTALKHSFSLPFFVGLEINPRLLDGKIERITILADSVPSFCTTATDFTILNSIPSNKEITLVIDESNSLGILGTNGCGIYATTLLPKCKRKIMIASLGKAWGLTGGVIASDAAFINNIKNLSTFISSAGMNAAFAQTVADAENIYVDQHKKMKANLDYIQSHLVKNKAVDFDKNYPLLYPEIEGLKELLLRHKIITTNFKYATGISDLNRIVITANHREADLDAIISVLNAHQL